MKRSSSWLGCLVLMLSVVGCAEEPVVESAPEPGPRVENAALGIALASVPPPFEVRSADEESIVLASPSSAGAGGIVTVAVGPLETGGINLIELAKAKNEEFKQLPDGQSFGNRELGTQIGPAFTARGSYTGEQGALEETWVLTLHPSENRLLTISYRYPAGGDSGARVNEVMAVLGEIEALGSP